jgi:hypothetical protein
MRVIPVTLILLGAWICTTAPLLAQEQAAQEGDVRRWVPWQAMPRGVVITRMQAFEKTTLPNGRGLARDLGAEHMMVQSLAGLAAQAVNEERHDELIWIWPMANRNYKRWFDQWTAQHDLEQRGTLTPWELVRRYREAGLVRGYVLYHLDESDKSRAATDDSVNIATTLCGLLGGVLISEQQQAQAEAAGLTQLADARGKDVAWLIERYSDRLNRSFALAQDPRIPYSRDIAVAHRMAVVWGVDESTRRLCTWLHPLSTIMGWLGGDEGQAIRLTSSYAHTLIPADWSINLLLLSAQSHPSIQRARFQPLDPRQLDLTDSRPAVAFVMSDGDNLQWMMGDFFENADFWANPHHGAFPMGWGMAAGEMAQACPDILAYAVESRPALSTVIQHGAGYFYPDLFGSALPDNQQEALLVQQARRINEAMRITGCRVLTFICMDLDSAQAQRAYAILARQIDNLVSMLAVQYAPYAAGDGRVYWVLNREGIQIPVVTAKYCLWADSQAPNHGSPSQIAARLNQDAREAASHNRLMRAWVMTHAWSEFPSPKQAQTTKRGLTPTYWCVQSLDKQVRVVSPEELLWRIRWEHDPQQTSRALERWTP